MIGFHSFVERQTKESRFSYFAGSMDDLGLLVRDHFDKAVQGYRDGVLEVPLPVDGFFSGVVQLEEGDKLVGGFESRRKGEAPRKFVEVSGSRKMPAQSVTIILYSSELLAEDQDNTLPPEPGNWEIISINASPCIGREPMSPDTLMANYYGSDGGTDTKMSPEEFVEALKNSYSYWKNKAMSAGEIK